MIILPYIPSVFIASRNATFAEMGLSVDNAVKVFRANGSLAVWNPQSSVNQITGIETGKGYYVTLKEITNIDGLYGVAGSVGIKAAIGSNFFII